MKEVPTRFDSNQEKGIYEAWERSGIFEPTGEGPVFSMVTPPPNVTGDLHLGHALTYAIEDTIARHRRRGGDQVLVVPGVDHAGIATQILVEKKLQKERGLSRRELGREKFEAEIWRWVEYYLPRLKDYIRRFGLSCAWSRFRFTLDEHSSLAVRTAFVQLYERGLIYRGEYLINWDPKLQTAIADDEVEYREASGRLYWIKYGPITVATTRPETKLGDTAIAVHPQDKRYRKYIGKNLEFTNELGEKQTLPVIADEAVDLQFGSGALKVTPAHDPTDFALGKKHHLPLKSVIDQFGRMTEGCGKYAGLKTLEAREKIVADLESLGLIEKISDHQIRQPIGGRSGAVIELLISTQWFVKTTALKEEARQVVKSGQIRFFPKNMEKVYFHWLDNLHDWCISRQLWWGHQIPAWYCLGTDKGRCLPACKEPIVALEEPKQCPHCGSKVLAQDPDVLDTWFSSSLWPFSTLGWPLDGARGEPLDTREDEQPETSDLERFFPTSLMETAADILFFWVSRMIMISLALTKQIPFQQVLFHGLVLDEHGQKMSKSKGNVQDPLKLIEEYGADALRMSLIGDSTPGLPQRYSQTKILKYRNFVTKIWNASRFVAVTATNRQQSTVNNQPLTLDSEEKKFFAALELLEKNNQKLFGRFSLNLALSELYEFFWHRFSDQFLEYEKKAIKESVEVEEIARRQAVLRQALARQIDLISDFAPFVCQEIKDKILIG